MSNSDPTSAILNERETLFESGMERNLRICRDPLYRKKFSNLSPEILVEWIAHQENEI